MLQTWPMDAARHELARQVMLDLKIGDEWQATLDPDCPPWVVEFMRQTVDAYRAGDLEWLLQETHPEAEIAQPPEIPGARSYRGREGMIDALLDWPREWENFSNRSGSLPSTTIKS